MDRLIKISEAAKMLNVSISTLRRWDKNGNLKSIRIGSNGNRRYKMMDIEKLIGNE